MSSATLVGSNRSSHVTTTPSTALSDACKSGSYSFVQSKIKLGEKPDSDTLTLACGSRVISIVDAVVKLGAPANETTLTVACSTGITEIVQKAIAAGAKATYQTFIEANRIGNPDILKLLGPNPYTQPPAPTLEAPLSPMRKFDVKHGVGVERIPMQDRTLLRAAGSGNVVTLKAALEDGWKPLQTDAQEELTAACASGNLECVDTLLSHIKDARPGNKTLTVSFKSGNLAIVDRMAERNAEPDVETFHAALETFINDRAQACAAIDKAVSAGAKPNDKTLSIALEYFRKLPSNYSLDLLIAHLHQKGGAKPSAETLTLACKTLYLPEHDYFPAYEKLLGSVLKTGAKPDAFTWQSIQWFSTDDRGHPCPLSDSTLDALFKSGLKPSLGELEEMRQKIVVPVRMKSATPIKDESLQGKKNEIYRKVIAKANEALPRNN